MKLRPAATALALVAAALLAPGAGALAGPAEAHAAPVQAPAQALVPAKVKAPAPAAPAKISHAAAASMFRSSGITWSSSGGCSDRDNPRCTSFEQLNLATAQGAQTLKSASGCALNVTGGTETGHASSTYSHWNGYKLDYSKGVCVGNYIRNTFTRIADRPDGAAQWRSGSGNLYADEGDHWDVTYYSCGGC